MAERSGGRFGPNPQSTYERWEEFLSWAATADLAGGEDVEPAELAAPVPSPRQSLGVALNYRTPGASRPDPPTLQAPCEFPSCLAGPDVDVTLPSTLVDYEVELVCVIGRATAGVGEADGVDHVAGVMVGQDLTDRSFLGSDPSGQLSLPKSRPGFGPTGPWVLTSDEPGVRGELELECASAVSGPGDHDDGGDDPLDSAADRADLGGLPAAARGSALHRHTERDRDVQGAAPLPARRGRG